MSVPYHRCALYAASPSRRTGPPGIHFIPAGAVGADAEPLAEAAPGGAEALQAHANSPAFLHIRALAVEAYYSDFLAPGAPGPSAYHEIDFHSPLAMRIDKDWSYLGIGG